MNEGIELWALAAVLRRRWKTVLALPLVVGLLSLATADRPPLVYRTQLAFAVDIPRSALLEGSDEGTAAKIGESLVDDLARMVGRDQFALAVSKRLPAGVAVSLGEIAAELSAEDKHRILDLTVSRSLPGEATAAEQAAARDEILAIADAVEMELREDGGTWFARLGEQAVSLTLIDAADPPSPQALSLRQRLDLPLRLALAFLAALGAAALQEGLDRRIHDAAGVRSQLGLGLLGSIPRRR
jgi:capsular polysaccharide biosynthesis protein